MIGLKFGMSMMAGFGGTLFGMALTQTLIAGEFRREQARLFGLSVICICLDLLVVFILHRRGFMKKGGN